MERPIYSFLKLPKQFSVSRQEKWNRIFLSRFSFSVPFPLISCYFLFNHISNRNHNQERYSNRYFHGHRRSSHNYYVTMFLIFSPNEKSNLNQFYQSKHTIFLIVFIFHKKKSYCPKRYEFELHRRFNDFIQTEKKNYYQNWLQSCYSLFKRALIDEFLYLFYFYFFQKKYFEKITKR